MSTQRLDGKVAWISGGASGMGEATAELFADEGAKVAIVDIQEDRLLQVVSRINESGGSAIAIPCDVSDEDQVQSAIEQTAGKWGGIQILANCAGIVDVAPLHQYTHAKWNRLMGINVSSIFFAVKHGIQHLRKHKRSYIVNIGSVGSFIGQGMTPAYIASKHAVLGLSRSIALDYAADGLRCNCVCPGITDTPMLRYHLSKAPDPDAALASRLKRVPIGVALRPEDIARAVLYLSCEDSAGITGTSLVIDGGYITPAEWEHPGNTAFMDQP